MIIAVVVGGGEGGLLSSSLSLLLPSMPSLSSVFVCCVVFSSFPVPASSPSRGGDVAVYVFDINQLSLPTPFYSVLASVSVFMALSTLFHSINSSDNSLLSDSVLLVLFLPYCSFQLHISL